MREREDLESARIGQDGAIPTHETMDAAGAPKDFRAWPQEQMICVGEQNLRPCFFERTRELRLHRRLGPNRHEDRRLHFVMQSAKGPGPGGRIARLCIESKIQTRRSQWVWPKRLPKNFGW